MSQAVPATSDAVEWTAINGAIRLGWTLVQLEALYQESFGSVEGPSILLEVEYSAGDQAVEAARVAIQLSQDLGVAELFRNAAKPKTEKADDDRRGVEHAMLRLLREAMRSNPEVPTPQPADFSQRLSSWAQRIQQEFATRSIRQDAAFQLGIGFAHIRWRTADHFHSRPKRWFYLGESRVSELERLLQIVSFQWDPLTFRALDSSLWAWGRIAANNELQLIGDRNHEEPLQSALRKQCSVWSDLLVGGVKASSLLTPEDEARSSIGASFRVARRFLPSVVLFVVSALALALVAYLVGHGDTSPSTSGPSETRALSFAVAVLGVFGITAAGILAKANTAAASFTELVLKARRDSLVIAAATVLPAALRGEINLLDRGRDLSPDPTLQRWMKLALRWTRGGFVTGSILWLLVGLVFWGFIFQTVERWGSIAAESLWLGGFLVFAYSVAAEPEPRQTATTKLSVAAFVLVGLYGAALMAYWILKDSGRIDQTGPLYLIPIVTLGLIGLFARVAASRRIERA